VPVAASAGSGSSWRENIGDRRVATLREPHTLNSLTSPPYHLVERPHWLPSIQVPGDGLANGTSARVGRAVWIMRSNSRD